MTYVCLWSPDWRTGVGPTPELAQQLLEVVPRIRTENIMWADKKSLPARELAGEIPERTGADP